MITFRQIMSAFWPVSLITGIIAIATSHSRYKKARKLFSVPQKINSELDENGLIVTDEFVDTGAVNHIISIVNSKFYDRENVVSVIKGKYVRGFFDASEALYLNETSVPYEQILQLIYGSSLFRELQFSHGCEFYCRSIAIFKTLPREDVPMGSFRFHRDGHPPYSFKILMYLTDVDQRSGPTSYIPGSVKRLIPEFGFYKFTRPIDEAVYRKHAVIGRAGTAILFNVNGAHAGGRTREGERIIMTLVLQPRWNKCLDPLTIAKNYHFNEREFDVN